MIVSDCIAIFAALRWECQPVLRRLRQVSRERAGPFTVWRGRTPAHEISLIKTGVGVRQAEAAARAMHDRGPFALFMSTGCAGALSPALIPGDLTVASALVGNPPRDQLATDPAHRHRACEVAERAALRLAVGPVLCSENVLSTVAAKRAAAARGAIAVEMEGLPIAAQARQCGAPFISVRAILDTADTEVRHAGRFIEPRTGVLKPLALAGYLAAHPRALPELLGMQRMLRAAQNALEKFFEAWLAEPWPAEPERASNAPRPTPDRTAAAPLPRWR